MHGITKDILMTWLQGCRCGPFHAMSGILHPHRGPCFHNQEENRRYADVSPAYKCCISESTVTLLPAGKYGTGHKGQRLKDTSVTMASRMVGSMYNRSFFSKEKYQSSHESPALIPCASPPPFGAGVHCDTSVLPKLRFRYYKHYGK